MLFSSALCAYVIDRLSKLFAVRMMYPGQSVEVIPKIFNITLVLNSGAAFGLFKDRAAFFIVISAFIITLIILYAWRQNMMAPSVAVSLGLILGGSLGNLVDRASFGYVIDYFDFRIWPVFNIADSAICVGVGILILGALTGHSRENASNII